MDTNNRRDILSQIEYYLIRLLLITLLLIAAYKLVKHEIHHVGPSESVQPTKNSPQFTARGGEELEKGESYDQAA